MELDKLVDKLCQRDSSLNKAEVKAQIQALVDREVVAAACSVRFTYYEHGQRCHVNTLYLRPEETIHIQLDRMPGHSMDIERLAALKPSNNDKELE